MNVIKRWIELSCMALLVFGAGCCSIKLPAPVARFYQRAHDIRYQARQGADIWQTPNETAVRQTGNCVDKAIYLNALLQQDGYDSELAFGIVRRLGGDAGHAWVVLDEDTILDPTDGWVTQADDWVYLEKRFLVNEFNESFMLARMKNGE